MEIKNINVCETFPDGTPIDGWFYDTNVPSLEKIGKQYVLTAYGILDDGKLYTKEIQALIDLAAKEAFAHTAAYDVAIANYMSGILNEGPTPPEYLSAYEKVTDLRYGENPHQKAAFYKEIGTAHGMGALKQLHGKELSYNNIVDTEAAWNMVCCKIGIL